MYKVYILIIASIIVTFGATSGIIWLTHYETNLPVPATRPKHDFSDAIARGKPNLVKSHGQPIFTIVRIEKIVPKWYLVKIQQENTPSISIESSVIVNDPYFDANYMNVAAGPTTNFSKTELSQDNIPTSVIQKVLK